MATSENIPAEELASQSVLSRKALEELIKQIANADTANKSAIRIEADRAKAAEDALTTALGEEEARATRAENAITTLVGTLPEGTTATTVVDYAAALAKEAEDLATDKNSKLAARVDSAESAINTLNGDVNVPGSVQKTVADSVAKIVNENNNGSIDTLNEIAAWIINDTTGAAKMKTDIATLNGAVTVEGSVKKQVADALSEAKQDSLDKIGALDAVVESTENAYVTVKVTQIDGLITTVNVTNNQEIVSSQDIKDMFAAASTDTVA